MQTNQNGSAIELSGAGPLLRRWREARHLSQLELALEAEVSARHISFLETGRATPSREMLLMLSNVLEVPLRERNVLLQAAGYAPVYRETSLDDPEMSHVRAAVELILKQHEPHSALAFNRQHDIIMANAAYIRLLDGVLPDEPIKLTPLTVTAPPRLNLLRLVYDPTKLRKLILNWEPIAKSLLSEAFRSAAWARDEQLEKLLAEILSYPGVPTRWREPDFEAPRALILPIEMKVGDRVARMFSTVTTVGRPQDVTLEELHIEAFYPADDESDVSFFTKGSGK
jgi:transcriptional regulator with XRE-family HTH domain